MPSEDVKFNSFQTGVVLSLPPDEIPDTASPRMYNTHFAPQAGGGYGIQVRPGLVHLATHTSGLAIAGLATYNYKTTSTSAEYVIAANASGSLNVCYPSTTLIAQTSVSVAGTNIQMVQAKNVLYGCSGSSNFVVYRTSGSATMNAYPWGLIEPVAGAFTNVTTSGASQSGTYNFKYTWYSSHLDSESSPKDNNFNSAVGAFDAIKFDLTTTNYPPNATHWHIYVRRQDSMTQYYRDADMRIPIATTSTTLSFSSTRLLAMIIGAPEDDENDPPPAGIIHSCWHLSRMFVTDGSLLYYSNINNPNAFNPINYEFAAQDDGQKITHLLSFDETNLVVFKERSIYILTGTGPANWEIQKVPTSFGCICPGAAVLANTTIFSWSLEGPVKWTVGQQVEPIFNEVVRPLADAGVLTLLGTTPQVCYNPSEGIVLFSVTPTGDHVKWKLLPYNVVLDCWESLGWDVVGVRMANYNGAHNRIKTIVGNSAAGTLSYFDQASFTDLAQNATGANLYFTAAGTSTAALTFTHTTSVLPTSVIFTPSVSVIDSATLLVHKSDFSLGWTTASSTVTLTLTTPMATTAGSVSTVVFDMPVAVMETKVQRTQTAYRRMLEAWADFTATGDIKVWVGAVIDNAKSAAKTWHSTIKQSHSVEYVTATTISGAKKLFKSFVGKRYLSAKMRIVMYYPIRQAITAIGWKSAVQSGRR